MKPFQFRSCVCVILLSMLLVGDYEWLVGVAGNQQRDTLMTFVTADALKTLVQFNTSAFGLKSVYKPELIK